MLFLTTTAIDVDEELLNRCLVLTIDESREQTAAIQARQRTSRTLDGLLSQADAAAVLEAHRAAQQMLRPLAVVNPFAEQLTFATERVRLRRDHAKYLALIDAIALLHQYQRPVKAITRHGSTIEYVEVLPADIALANRLAHEVLGRSLDELSPPTRRLLGTLQRWVGARAQAQGITSELVRFTRRELRAEAGMSGTQLRVHLDRLVELEYVLAHAGRNGQRFVYELAFDGDVQSERPQVVGLIDMEQLQSAGTTPNLVASRSNLAGSLRVPYGPLAATSRQGEMPRNASPDTAFPVLAAAVEENAHPEPVPRPRRNGSSYLPAARN